MDTIRIRGLAAFAQAEVSFLHPRQDVARLRLPTPRYPNLNLLVGGNGAGKTTLLKAVALAGLGPAVARARLAAPTLARVEPEPADRERARRRAAATRSAAQAVIEATFLAEAPAARPSTRALGAEVWESRVVVERRGATERLSWQRPETGVTRAALAGRPGLLLGYGATRAQGRPTTTRRAPRPRAAGPAPDQVRGLFDEAHPLTPLAAWLPALRRAQPRRFAEVVRLLNNVLAPSGWSVTGENAGGECVFERRGLRLPGAALSDGCRALLSWMGDLLYHLCQTCPASRRLVDQPGLVLVDEVDLHLHPRWQMTLLPTLARCLPRLQFIVTSHSPLLVGSLEWVNLIAMQPGPRGSFAPARLGQPVHGLDADQLLLTDYFGLESTRAPDKQRRLRELTWRTRTGDAQAAKELLEALSRGEEGRP